MYMTENKKMSPLEVLQNWKSKPYRKTNYENIDAYYGDQKYVRMKPRSQISLTEGFFHTILKHPQEWVQQNIKLEREVTLCNESNGDVYFTLLESIFSDDEHDFKLHIKSGVDPKEKLT